MLTWAEDTALLEDPEGAPPERRLRGWSERRWTHLLRFAFHHRSLQHQSAQRNRPIHQRLSYFNPLTQTAQSFDCR